MTFARLCIHSYIEALSDMFPGIIDRDLFYYRATSSILSYVLDGMTAGEAYYQYFNPVAELSERELQRIVYADQLDSKYVCCVITDLRASVRNDIVSRNGVE